jgi:two-component system NtrC family sensor kinase
LDIKTGDEIQQLAVQFNDMASALKTLYSNLEEKVLEKTEELQKAYARLQTQQDELKNAYEELKQIHERLRESEEKYSDIVENAYDMIMTTDAEGTITSVNHKLTETVGYTADELLGSHMEKIIPSSYAETTKTALRQVIEKGSISDFETALQSKEGRTIRVEVNASGIQRDDKYVGMRAILRDIEQRKILEAQLLQSEKLSSVGQLASGVAHEINNPVGVISMFTQMLLETRKDQPDDPEVEKLQLIESQAEHIAKITKNLLEFARPKEFQIGRVDINKSIENTLELVKPHLHKQKVELVMNLAEGLPEILGDGTQLDQVFMNLTLNALHSMPEGGRLSISTTPATVDSGALENGGVEIRISDSGCGIPKEDLHRIFEPFFTTKKVGKGTGLGLSVTYNIVKNHKGSLLVESEEGHGSTFVIRLPVRF